MLWLDPRAARYTWTVAFILLLLILVYLIREALFIFAIALLFAYLLWPLVDFFDRRLPGISRAPALAIVYASLIALLFVVGFEVGILGMAEASSLATKVPEMISQIQHPDAPIALLPALTAQGRIMGMLRQQLAEHSRELLALLPNAALNVLSHAGNLIYIVLVPILSFFFMKDGREIARGILGAFGEESRRDIVEIAAELHLLLAQYVRALVFLALSAFAAFALFFFLIGLPYAILLAAIVSVLEFIPLVGPLVASGIILTVAGLGGSPHLIWILIFIISFRFFQDYVLSPLLLSAGVRLHPLVVIFGVLAGGAIAGVPGIFLSVPVLATLRIVFRQLEKKPLVAG